VSVFGGIWAASAFKGATGPCAVATDIGYHIENHKQWISVVSSDIRPLTDKFHGYALTGWQRYSCTCVTSVCIELHYVSCDLARSAKLPTGYIFCLC